MKKVDLPVYDFRACMPQLIGSNLFRSSIVSRSMLTKQIVIVDLFVHSSGPFYTF